LIVQRLGLQLKKKTPEAIGPEEEILRRYGIIDGWECAGQVVAKHGSFLLYLPALSTSSLAEKYFECRKAV
jgi:hypothetical protein